MDTTEPLKDGFYLDLPFSRYLDQLRIGKGVLMAHRKSAAHAWHEMHSEKASTPAMRAGTLAHTLILEPDTFHSRYAIGPVSDRRLKAWTEWNREMDTATDLRERITPNEHAAGVAMTGWIERMPKIASLLRGPGPVESSVFWTDRPDEDDPPILFRARPDKLAPGLLIDVKTTTDLSTRALQRKILDMGYHLQARLYMDGLEAAAEIYVERAVIIWVETSAPFQARATVLTEPWMDLAEQELAWLKMQHRACLKSGKWPGYMDGEDETLMVPKWALDGMDADLEIVVGGKNFTA